MKLTHRALGKSDVVIAGITPSQRYLLGSTREMPLELTAERIPVGVLDAHSADVTKTLTGLTASAKNITDSTGLSLEKVLLGAYRLCREVV